MSQPPNTKPSAIRFDDAGGEPHIPRRRDGTTGGRRRGDPDLVKRRSARQEREADPRFRVDPGTSWLRFRGRGGRGMQPRHVRDDFDLKLACDELAAGREALRKAHEMTPHRHQTPSREAREALKAALAKLALAARAIDEVVIRRGGITGDAILDGDE